MLLGGVNVRQSSTLVYFHRPYAVAPPQRSPRSLERLPLAARWFLTRADSDSPRCQQMQIARADAERS